MLKRGIGFLALLLLFCGGLVISQAFSNVALASEDLLAYIEDLYIENHLLSDIVVQLREQIEVLETELEKLQSRSHDLDQRVIAWPVEPGKSVVLVASFHELDSLAEFKSINMSEAQILFDFGDEQRCLSLDEFDLVVAFYGSSPGSETLKSIAQENYGSSAVLFNNQSYDAEEVLLLTNRILVVVLINK